jgi:hypothetical protein
MRFARSRTAEDAWKELSGDFQNPTNNELLDVAPLPISVTTTATPDPLANLSLMSWSTDVRIATGEDHYINVRRPAIGTASATVKLAPNGTLTEATASVDDQTISGIVTAVTSLIPISDIVSSAVGLSSSAEQSGGHALPDPQRVRFASYSAVAQTRTYTVTADYRGTVPSSCSTLRSLAAIDGAKLTIAAPGASGETKPDTAAFTITGSVVPPKAPVK